MCSINGSACVECDKLPAVVAYLADVADHTAPGTNYNLLLSRQLQCILQDKDSKLCAMRLEVFTELYIFLMI